MRAGIGLLVIVLSSLVCGQPVATAQAPSVTSIQPRGVQPGASVEVTLTGGNLNDVVKLWTSADLSAEYLTPEKPTPKTARFRITAASDLQPGIHALRIVTKGGVSAPALFAIDDLPGVAQDGKNTAPSTAQPVETPIAIDGRLDNLARNYYRFGADAGQTISIEVLARRLGSPLDPMIRLIDAEGRELAYSDDEPGLRADCRLQHTFEESGDYVVEVRDIRYQGGGGHFYRLRIGDFPCVTVPYPMGAKRGTTASLDFATEHSGPVETLTYSMPDAPGLDWVTVGARRPGGKSSGFATLALSDRTEVLEKEPNDTREAATPFELGQAVNGRLQAARDEDHFTFSAKKGQTWVFRGTAREQGSPAALLMRLLDGNGNQLALVEDFGVGTPVLTYGFKADGDYTLAIRDLHQRGGAGFAYRVTSEISEPGFALTAAAHTLNVGQNGTVAVSVSSARKGYNGPIEVSVEGLPAGVTAHRSVIGPGQNSVVLTIGGGKETAPGSFADVRIVGRATIGERDVVSRASVEGALKGSLNGLPWAPQVLEKSVALAVGPKTPIAFSVTASEVTFGRNLSANVKLQVERPEGADEQVTFALNPPKNALPGGISAAVKPIPKGQNEVELVFSANEKAPLGEFTAVLTGTLKQGKTTHQQSVPGIILRLKEPFALSIEPQQVTLQKDTAQKVKVKAERNPAFDGPIEVVFDKLPKGVTAEKATIAKGTNEIEVELKAGGDAAAGATKGVVAKGSAMAGKAKLSGSSPGIEIRIE